MQIYSFSPFGYEGALVSVEVDLRKGLPGIDMVGLADGAVKESRERMRSAIRNSGLQFPLYRVLINLSPADLKKEGAGFDLPIALAVLVANEEKKNDPDEEDDIVQDDILESDNSASEIIEFDDTSPVLIMGELELSGKIRAVRGINAAASSAYESGITRCIVAKDNAAEAREVSGMKVYGADSLSDAFKALCDKTKFQTSEEAGDNNSTATDENTVIIDGVAFQKVTSEYEYAQVKGQRFLVRGLQIAAAGGLNLIAIGSPGCGKTMAIQKFPGLLPLLTTAESQPVMRIMSLAGILSLNSPKVRVPPFRAPHQTASMEGLCGGGPYCTPGEASLAHNGVLFLDEAAEFKQTVLQALRIPLESGTITLSRAGRSSTFPASFQLLMAANPCPCGNYGSETKVCLCSARAVEMYWKKFSAPLIDRIDIRIPVKIESEIPNSEKTSITTDELRVEIARAIKTQRERQKKRNGRLTSDEIEKFCKIDDETQSLLSMAETRYGFSQRSLASILKTARTIADMAGSQNILIDHVREAIKYKKSFTNFMDMKM